MTFNTVSRWNGVKGQEQRKMIAKKTLRIGRIRALNGLRGEFSGLPHDTTTRTLMIN